DVALGAEVLGQMALDVREKGVDVAFIRRTELVYKRAGEPFLAGVEHAHQVGAALRAVDLLVDTQEELLDLLIELGPVRDDEDAPIRHVFADPFGEPDHDQALAAALGVPDDSALAPLHARLRRTN